MRRVRIGDVTAPVEAWNPQASESDATITYVDISSVDASSKTIVKPSTIAASDAPSRARQLLKEGDVLISTVRPGLNAVALVTAELDGATASTGFCVLRPLDGRIDGRYLFHWVRTKQFVRHLEALATGASYPAVSERIVREAKLPLPDFAEQRRIADLLDRADTVRRKREDSRRLADELLRSVFLEMFGDPVRNEKGWEVVLVSDVVVDTQYGTATKANASGRGVKVLRMNNVTYSGRIDLSELKSVELPRHSAAKFTVQRGDLLFNRTNSPELVGKTAVWNSDEEYAFAGYLVRVRLNDELALPEYVNSVLNSDSGKGMLRAVAKPSNNMSNISASVLRSLRIPLPPLALQEQFRSITASTQHLAERVQGACNEVEVLAAGLSARLLSTEK